MQEEREVVIGWVGLGRMGSRMMQLLFNSGYTIVAYNRTKSKADLFAKRGVKIVETPLEVASQSDIIFLAVSDDQALEEITLGERGVLKSCRKNQVLIDMSTVSPLSSSRVARGAEAKEVFYLRAPVSGSTTLAEAGKLTILVSGKRAAYEQTHNILEILGEKIIYLGEEEEARYMKLVINIIVAGTCQLLAESLTLAKKAGLEIEPTLDVLASSVAASPFVLYKIRPIRERDFSAMASIELLKKDLDLALDCYDKLRVPAPLTALTKQLFAAASSTGKGDLDIISLILLAEELAGIH